MRKKRAKIGSGLASNLASLGLKMGSKAINSVLRKKLINKGIDSIPSIFKYGVSKIKNKNVQRALDTDIANYVVDKAQKIRHELNQIHHLIKMTSKGIGNVQSEDAISNIGTMI